MQRAAHVSLACTRMFRGPPTETDIDRIGEILQYVDDPSKKVFKMALKDSVLQGTSCCLCVVLCVCVCLYAHAHIDL